MLSEEKPTVFSASNGERAEPHQGGSTREWEADRATSEKTGRRKEYLSPEVGLLNFKTHSGVREKN